MIRVVTLEKFEATDLTALCKLLDQAYGLGCEPAGNLPLPEEAAMGSGKNLEYDAATLIEEAETVKLMTNDKLVYVTRQKLSQPEGPLGKPPTNGWAEFGGQRSVISTAGFPSHLEEETEEFQKRLAKQAVREIGATWELHTCIDPKCAMHPSWTEAFEANVEPVLCTFCREKSEETIRLATS